MVKNSFSFFLVRLGVAVVFLYAAISSFLQPQLWSSFFPLWFQKNLPVTLLLYLFSLYEISLSLLILSGKKTKLAGILASLTLLSIIVVNLRDLDIIFRDIAIFFAALSLVFFDGEKASRKQR